MLIVAKLKTTFQISNNKNNTQIIFLPANSQMEDSIVFLDKIYHVDNRFINRDTLEDQRLFSLSDYGFYMLIFKLSIHFSRIQEKVNRGCIAN